MICRIHNRTAKSVALFAVLMLIATIRPDAQGSSDFELTTDAGEKFHLVHTQGSNYDIYTEANGKKIGSVDMRTHNPVVIGPDFAMNGAAMQRGMAAANQPGHMQMYSGPATPALSDEHTLDAAQSGGESQDLPPCPMGSFANYWNGKSWSPLRTPDELNGKEGFSIKEALKNPVMANYRGRTGIARFKGADSPVTVSSSPKFCFTAGPNTSPSYLIGFVDVKGDTREIEFSFSDRGPEKWIPHKRQKPVTQMRPADRWILVSPTAPLPPGQYIIGISVASIYDFGVQ